MGFSVPAGLAPGGKAPVMAVSSGPTGREVRPRDGEGPGGSDRADPPGFGQEAFSETSSITKLVCRPESSVPLKDRVTVWPAKEDTLKVFAL
jgi:hypothetical protein